LQRIAHGFRNVVAIEQRNEGHRPAALVQQKVEQFALVFLEYRDLAREGDFDGALVLFPEHVRVGLEFGVVGIAAGQWPPAVAEVLIQDGAGKAKGAGIHRFAEQGFDLCGFGRFRRAFHRRFAHDVMPERCQWREETQVHRRFAPRRRIHEFRKGLPIPGDAFRQYLERNGLDIDQIAHRDFARLGPAGGNAHTAVAHHYAGDTVPGRRGDRAVPADLGIVMRMRVDESRRNDAIGAVDGLPGAAIDPADLDDLATRDCDVSVPAGRTRPIDDQTVPDYQIPRHAFLRWHSLNMQINEQ